MYNDFWEYNPVSNSWIQKADVTTLMRNEPAYFSIGTKGYIGMGYNYSGPYLKDFGNTPQIVHVQQEQMKLRRII
ncbi:MAG: hypothetical protein IPN54_05730 [Bacteroidetes bacterium]|nr:hypothetical protein [Bacteroidota bacterium]